VRPELSLSQQRPPLKERLNSWVLLALRMDDFIALMPLARLGLDRQLCAAILSPPMAELLAQARGGYLRHDFGMASLRGSSNPH